MKRRRLLIMMASIVGLFASPALGQQSWAEKMFETKSHDFRTVGRGAKSVFEFAFTNIYEEDVRVAAVRTSCGCTTPTISKKLVKSRETGSIVATFNTDTFIGKKAATITVVFDKPFYSEIQLKVRGHIRTDIWFEPSEVDFGEIAPGKTGETEVTITHAGSSNWRITDVRSHCTDLQVRLNPPEIQAGRVSYKMLIKTKDSMPEGDIRERLTLISNDRNFPTTEMLIAGRVRPTLSVSPENVSLGTVTPGTTIEKRLLVRGEEPFEITSVACPDKRFEFDKPEGEKKLHFVKMRFTAKEAQDKIAQQVRIKTSLGETKFVECLVTGSVGNVE